MSDSYASTTLRDVIRDFDSGTDLINLHFIDANTEATGNQSFTFTGTQAKAYSVWYGREGEDLVVRADNTGDGVRDMTLLVENQSSLTAGDFVL